MRPLRRGARNAGAEGGGAGAGVPFVVAPTGASFTTIAAAIAAAVADGASLTSPRTVLVMGGSYTETFALPSGIRLVAAGGSGAFITTNDPNGARLVDCTITLAAGQLAAIVGFNIRATGAEPQALITLAAGAQLFLSDCSINTQSGTFSAIDATAGGFVSLEACAVRNGTPPGIQVAGAGGFQARECQFVGVGDSCVTVGGSTSIDVRDCDFAALNTGSGMPLFLMASTAQGNIRNCFFQQLDTSAHAIDIGATNLLLITHCTFMVVDGGTNNAINGAAGATLLWGALDLALQTLAGVACTDRVATTTIGAGAVNIVVDTITAV